MLGGGGGVVGRGAVGGCAARDEGLLRRLAASGGSVGDCKLQGLML
jgi:hypothetical protein